MNKENLRHIIRESLNLIHEKTSDVKVKKETSEDETRITVYVDGEKAGDMSMEVMFSPYDWYFSDEFSEEKYDEMFPDDEFIKFSHIEVEDKYKGASVAAYLMELAIKEAKKLGYKEIYLNAFPMGFNGLKLNDLVKFYEHFGFKEILHQGGNVQMLLSFR